MPKDAETIRNYIDSHELFSTLHDDDRAILSGSATLTKLDPGSMLIRQGEFNPHLFIIMDGKVKIFADGNTIATLGAGDIVGEISASGLSFPIADAIADSKVTALAFPIETINDIAWEHQEFAEKLREIGTTRVADGVADA